MRRLKKIVFMGKRFLTDLNENKELEIYPNTSDKLTYYYFKFTTDQINTRGGNKPMYFDENGVPQIHSYIDVEDKKGYYYYPITIGQYALALFNEYVADKSEDRKKKFLAIADWFIENKMDDDKLGTFWLTHVPKPEYKMFEPWKSAFTQSRAISVLLRAWQVTNEQKYFSTAANALIPFTVDAKEGGVSSITKHGNFYEEYAAPEPTMVLDGHNFSLLGLFDFYRAVGEDVDSKNRTLAKNLFDEGIESLIKWLPEYDMGFWLRFNMCGMSHYPSVDPCTIGYLRLVSVQLILLYELTKRDELFTYYEKFAGYDKLKNILKMYPVKYKALKKLNRL